jgi:hypothetical protein
METTPFLDVDGFQGMFARALSVPERVLATLLCQAAANWIRDPSRLPDLPVSSSEAKLVTFDVVKAALARPAQYAGFTQVTRTTDDRTMGYTLEAAAELLEFTDRHREMLGLSTSARPRMQVDPIDPRVYSGAW